MTRTGFFRTYVTAGRDRWGFPFFELGRAEIVVDLDDGTRCPIVNGGRPCARFTLGNYAPMSAEVDGRTLHLSFGGMWLELQPPALGVWSSNGPRGRKQ